MNLTQGMRHALQQALGHVRAFMAGAALSWTAVPYLLHRRRELEQVFVLELYLGLRGLSPVPPSQRLWLLPFVVPQVLSWHRLRLWDDSLETANFAHLGH